MAVWAYPHIDPVALQIGQVMVRWYGLAYLAGFAAAILVAWSLNRRWGLGLTAAQLSDVLLAAALAVIVGGRLGYVLFYNLGHYLEDPLEIIAVWDGGMSFHGSLAGLMLAAVYMGRRTGIGFLRLTDLGAVGTPVGIFLGRLANFVNGELWGRTSDVPWAMVFPGAGPDPRHPSQLYEALLEGAVIFIVLVLLARKRRPPGTYVGVFLLLYGVFRFAIEFVREPDAQLGTILGALTMGQMLSLPMIGVGAWLVWKVTRTADEPPKT